MVDPHQQASEVQAPQSHLLTMLTTEHFVLQTAYGGTIGEANGRAAIYLGAVSSGLIALGFVADDSDRFGLFAAAILPALLLLGWFTFVRLVQIGVESLRYLIRIQRIRGWYAAYAPAGTSWFADVAAPGDHPDELAAAARSMGMRQSFWQMLYAAASMVGALNSLVLGAAGCLAIRGTDLLALPWAVGFGVALAIGSFAGHLVYERRQFGLGLV
jgi:MFS family permease